MKRIFLPVSFLVLGLFMLGCVPARHIVMNRTPALIPDMPSTLLPPNTTQLRFVFESSVPANCRYALGQSAPFERMISFDLGGGTTRHVTMLTGLSPDPNTINRVYVRCDAYRDVEVVVKYRSLSHVNPSFPRTGNLWGSWNLIHRGLNYCSRIDLWLGAHWRPDEIRVLRRLNPHVLVLASINAVDSYREVPARQIPADYFLKDIHGNRIEVWPGSYRLNLTKPEVAEFQARHAYQQVLDSDLMYDGLFIDNVFLSQSWQKHDIFGNPFPIDANEDGVEDNPMELDAAWRKGVLHELRTIRRLLPYAILSGHSIDIHDPDTATIFNATSIAFDVPYVIEGRMRFRELWDRYASWQSAARPPMGTMIESAVPLQIGYGYGYSPLGVIPQSTLEFARHYYPYMRFGLALTLMENGYFAHELGDTYHGNDWWYDELNFDLGYPLGPATFVHAAAVPETNVLKTDGFGVRRGSQPRGHDVEQQTLDVKRREFTNGLVLLNASPETRTITVGPGFERLTSDQAAYYEYILDDSTWAFWSSGDWKEVVYDSGEWKATGPYYHDWGRGSHEGKSGTAQWDLRIPEADVYTITAWWPAPPASNAWNANVTYEVVSDRNVVASATFDQRSGGDQWHLVGQVPLSPGAHVELRCDGSAPCIADALHVRSRKRYNDGSPAEVVTLQAMDGIILKRVR